jgi:uncharacterized Zn finger protein
MMKRNCKCPGCSPAGGAILDSGYSSKEINFRPMWICRNCGTEIPRRVLKTAKRARIGDTINRLIEGRF